MISHQDLADTTLLFWYYKRRLIFVIPPEVCIHPNCSGKPHRGLSVAPVPMEPMKGSVAAIISR